MQTFGGNMDPQQLAFPAQAPSQPRIMYFISRSNNTLVPLIPADELPYSVRLQNVPRTIRFDQTYGMQHVGTMPYSGNTFKLESGISMPRSTSQQQHPMHNRSHSNSPSKQFLPPDALARQAIANAAGTGADTPQYPLPQRPLSAHELTTTNWRRGPTSATSAPDDKTQAVIDAIVGATNGTPLTSKHTIPPPSGKIPDEDKKEYCTYWIRTGECDYMQQGCLYKHEMPDLDTLKAIGFRGTPRWWLEKNQKIKLTGPQKTNVSFSRAKDMPSWWSGQRDEASKPKTSTTSESSDGAGSEGGSERSDPPKQGPVILKKQTTPPAKATATATAKENCDSDDLIDFGLVLTPATTPSSTPEKQDPTARNPDVNGNKPTTSNKIFVPAGENPEAHIADARKRAARSPRVPKSTDAGPEQKKRMHGNGLMASKHAPAPGKNGSVEGRTASSPQQVCRKRVPKRAVPIVSPGKEGVVVDLPGGGK